MKSFLIGLMFAGLMLAETPVAGKAEPKKAEPAKEVKLDATDTQDLTRLKLGSTQAAADLQKAREALDLLPEFQNWVAAQKNFAASEQAIAALIKTFQTKYNKPGCIVQMDLNPQATNMWPFVCPPAPPDAASAK